MLYKENISAYCEDDTKQRLHSMNRMEGFSMLKIGAE
jgi:hypothetical protein